MFGNTFGRLFKITCCGESYAGGFRKNLPVPPELYGGLMVIVDGVPPGIRITGEMVQAELNKRKPGQTPLDSPRKEKDLVYIFSGVMENDLTTGAPVGMIIPNNDIPNILKDPSSYIESRDYLSWERFFTDVLVKYSADTRYAYKKAKLNEQYLRPQAMDAIASVLPECLKSE